jgi:hypothetical protein
MNTAEPARMTPNVNLVTGAVAVLPETDPPWLYLGCTAFRILADARHERDALALADQLASFVTDANQYATLQAAAAWSLWSMGRAAENYEAALVAGRSALDASRSSGSEAAAGRWLPRRGRRGVGPSLGSLSSPRSGK